jgi:hypothetical protein
MRAQVQAAMVQLQHLIIQVHCVHGVHILSCAWVKWQVLLLSPLPLLLVVVVASQ